MPGRQSNARPGRQWSRRFSHPYTARKTPPGRWVPIFGTDQTAPWAVLQAGFGTAYGYRGYNNPAAGVPTAWPGPGVTMPAGIPPAAQVVSIRPNILDALAGTLDSALAAFFATVPAGAFLSVWPEGELNEGQTTVTAAQLIAALTRLNGIFQKNAPASSSFGQIVAVQSAFVGHTGYPLGQWMCTAANGGANLDFYGMDVAPQTATTTYADNINVAIAAMVGAGVSPTGPWTITETAYHPIWLGSPAQWYSDGWNVAQAIGAIHYMPFYSPTIAGAYVLWPSPSVEVLRVLQDIAAVARGDPRSPPAATIAASTQAPLVASASTASLTATFTSNPAAGSKVLVAVQATGTAALAVTDNGTTPATFTLDASCANASSSIPSVYLYRADNITLPGAGTYAVTVVQAPTGKLQVAACAYTGVQNGPPSSTSSVTSTGRNPAVDPVTPDDQSSLFFSAFFCDSANSPESMGVASPEFTLQQVQSGSGGFPGAVADAIVTSPAPRAGGWSLPDAPDWSAVMAAYGAFPVNMQIVPGAEMVWAQAPVPKVSVQVAAGLASASGSAAVNPPGVNVPTGLASATGAALFSASGSSVSLTLTAVGPVGATGAALNAVVAPSFTAGLASATGAAGGPAATVSPALTAATATGGGGHPTATVTVAAAAAAATGAAAQPLATTSAAAATAAGTGAAPQPTATVTVAAGLAAGTGAALDTTVTTTGTTNANAVTAAATGAAGSPAVTVAPTAATAVATGTAQQPGTGRTAALATATGAGLQSSVAVASTAATAAATGTAPQPTVVTGAAPAAGLAAAAGTAAAVTPTVTVAAGLAAATGTAGAIAHGTVPAAPTATGAAGQPVASVTPTAGTAAASGTPGVIAHGATPGLASATGAAQAAALAELAQAAAARALAAALDAAGVGRADFTTGSLTASDAPGSVLTAATAAGALGTSGSLTATTQRTGGPS